MLSMLRGFEQAEGANLQRVWRVLFVEFLLNTKAIGFAEGAGGTIDFC